MLIFLPDTIVESLDFNRLQLCSLGELAENAWLGGINWRPSVSYKNGRRLKFLEFCITYG